MDGLFLLLFVLGTSIIGFFWGILIYQLFISEQNVQEAESTYRNMKHAYNFYRYTAAICFTFCLLTAIFDTWHGYLSFCDNHAMLLNYYSPIKGTADLLYFTASISLNMILFGRCFFTFKFSPFGLSTWTIAFISAQIIFSFLLSISYCVVMFIVENEQIADHWTKPLIITITANDFTLSISLLSLFIFKLHQLIVNIKNSNNTHNNDKNNNQQHNQLNSKLSTLTYTREISGTQTSINTVNSDSSMLSSLFYESNLDAHQLELIAVITRHTVLSGFAIFFNQMWYSLAYVSMKSEFESSEWFGLFIYASRLIGMT
eukprot:14774_1